MTILFYLVVGAAERCEKGCQITSAYSIEETWIHHCFSALTDRVFSSVFKTGSVTKEQQNEFQTEDVTVSGGVG
jgi:hypothetical protein